MAWRGRFAVEYKRRGKHATLDAAYQQLLRYHDALDNPPLLVACDIARFELHTKFTGYASTTHHIDLEELDRPEQLALLRRAFTEPTTFRPQLTLEQVTHQVAQDIGKLAHGLRDRGHDPHEAAHFLMKCMFCLFAEDVDLLPGKLFNQLLTNWRDDPPALRDRMADLFAAMRDGGAFGTQRIAYFNGGLFTDPPDTPAALELTTPEIGTLSIAAGRDWASVDPAIFGTLFERSLDPAKRAQIGAHYTGRDDILRVVEPVVMAPLRREWAAVRERVEADLERRRKVATARARADADRRIADALTGFVERLASVRILDPACGSGNFLYVALQRLLDLEKEVLTFAARPDIGLSLLPQVRPTQLHGIELNPYAAELAQVVIWIGYLQWMRDNGFNAPRDPILAPLQTIEQRDAILASPTTPTTPDTPTPSESASEASGPPMPPLTAFWPAADFIIGNPPFLGSKLFREHGLPDDYIHALYAAYDLPNTSDLCCYWFERARQQIAAASLAASRAVPAPVAPRVGLLATQGIRGGDNRRVLQRIADTGRITFAWSDLPWVLDGAAVHVSIVGFTGPPPHADAERGPASEASGTTEEPATLDGQPVDRIHPNLTADLDLTAAVKLPENAGLSFMGDTKGGSFDVTPQVVADLLAQPNPHGRSNLDVLRPWVNGRDITQRPRGMWIIDFGCEMGREEAARYEAPFEHVREHVKPARDTNKRESYRVNWWRHVEPRPDLRATIQPLARFIVTTGVSKFRLFAWETHPTLPDHAAFAFARSDDYFFGVLHSSVHELWALRQGTQLETRPRYTPTTCFETFPLPWPPGSEPGEDDPCRPLHDAIADAARTLDEGRERWLNPPEWVVPIADAVDRLEDFSAVPDAARPLLRQSAIAARAAADPRLKRRTLTNLYNARPTWLRDAHERLDRAVLAAYAATDPPPAGDWSPAWAAAWRDTGAGQPLPEDAPAEAVDVRRAADRGVLANLLRLNRERAGA